MTLTINPKNKKELKKVKTILKVLEMDFEIETKNYRKAFISKKS